MFVPRGASSLLAALCWQMPLKTMLSIVAVSICTQCSIYRSHLVTYRLRLVFRDSSNTNGSASCLLDVESYQNWLQISIGETEGACPAPVNPTIGDSACDQMGDECRAWECPDFFELENGIFVLKWSDQVCLLPHDSAHIDQNCGETVRNTSNGRK